MPPCTYLTVDEVLHFHERLIAETGGLQGLLNRGSLEAAVARPQAGFGNQDAYPGLSKKAAALLHSLAKNHAFIDGNKRTAYASSAAFLRLNGAALDASEDEKYDMVIAVCENRMDLEGIARWMETRLRPTQ